MCVYVCVHARAHSQSCPTLWDLQPAWLLCPWNFPGKNTGAGCHFLLQVIFPTQRENTGLLHLLHWQADSLPLHQLGSPKFQMYSIRIQYLCALQMITTMSLVTIHHHRVDPFHPFHSTSIPLLLFSLYLWALFFVVVVFDTTYEWNNKNILFLQTEHLYTYEHTYIHGGHELVAFQFSSVQSLSCVQLFATPWTAPCQASLSITNSWSLLNLTYIKLVMPSNHLILCHLSSVIPLSSCL